MTAPGFDVDPGRVQAVGTWMANAAASLGEAAGGGAGAPVAGTATGAVLAYLEAVTQVAARFAEAAQLGGETVGRAAEVYRRSDASAAGSIGSIPGFGD
ncbi:hypothetical protein [Actinomycetospora soli]|uniref:hypothetical protein n=1 Tax=Actinomycetospora soli TaxID=2893887 RepID=UPI001E5816D3|nr:hypothetical protein [Actinomycetospora soli]MCD2187794.1 hypothetical protein [Actinomycetospora soli]